MADFLISICCKSALFLSFNNINKFLYSVVKAVEKLMLDMVLDTIITTSYVFGSNSSEVINFVPDLV